MSRRGHHSLLVLAWHNVEGTWCFPSSPGAGLRGLEAQLRFLMRFWHVVPLGPALASLRDGEALPSRAVALTFDDGYRDNLELAVPLLESLRLPATFFLVPGLLAGWVEPWWERLAWAFTRGRRDSLGWEGTTFPLFRRRARFAAFRSVAERVKRRNRRAREASVEELVELLDPDGSPGNLFLDWDGARAIGERGFAVGSHSLYHAILSEESDDEQRRDLAESRRILETELNVDVDLLAYPNGTRLDFDEVTLEAARAAGYGGALTTVGGVNRPTTPPLEIRRFVVDPKRGEMEFALAARHLPLARSLRRSMLAFRRSSCRSSARGPAVKP